MGESSCDLTPGCIALRLDQRGDVVEDHDVSSGLLTLGRQRGASAHQHAPSDFAAQHDLLTPVGLSFFNVSSGGSVVGTGLSHSGSVMMGEQAGDNGDEATPAPASFDSPAVEEPIEPAPAALTCWPHCI